MFRTGKFIAFFIIALTGIAFCQAAEKSSDAKTVKTSKAAASVVVPDSKTAWVGLGFFYPIQFPDEDTVINGFRFSLLYTYNKGVNGVDFGVLCDSGPEGNNGVQMAISNRTLGVMNGLSLAFVNVAEGAMNGVQFGGLYNQAGSDSLDNAGAVYTNSSGFQLSFLNTADSIFSGFQMGCINISNTIFNGFQLGVINYANQPSDIFADYQSKEFKEEKKNSTCFQFGAINFNSNGVLPITLLINYSKSSD